MQIQFVRSGGFAGLRLATTIDMDDLPEAEAHELLEALDSAHFFSLPEQFMDAGAPDRFQYEITVDDGDRQHTVQAGDASLPDHLEPLVRVLERYARTHRRD
jgi:hypothetical protein